MSERAEDLLYLLKTRGPQGAQALGEALGMTSMGARQHLLKLAGEDLVTSFERREGVGRPKQAWRLTDKGHGRFPDRHSDLTLELISSVRELYGEEGLTRLIEKRELQARAVYDKALEEAATLEEKVERLAEQRNKEGYMARAERAEDGSLMLIEDHCPICAAASICQGFCRAELHLFEEVLGEGVTVARTDYMLEGGRRCAYRIMPD
ncbi:helix-turn-helix transcriptional regulator [Tepidicaulis sp. LMO-SS28]|uniref:helix-turn-helix transcriptional regulator n=1 Tax=Tepidicaulis sp. LMO-SS28 TaxID=3447455 RepID=UPI003EE05AEA